MNLRLLIFIILLGLLASCEPDNTPPVAVVSSNPGIGDTTTIFMLDASGCSDQESSFYVLRYRWDCDNDGTWDTDYSTRTGYAARFSKPGYQTYRLEVADEDGGTATITDSVFILSFNQDPDTLTDLRDGNRYPVIRIGETWWMADNLRFGTPIDWKTVPSRDSVVEYLFFNNDQAYQDYGALYTWEEAHYFRFSRITDDICPPGWRLPLPEEWTALFKSYTQPFDVTYYFGPNSVENLGIEMNGYYEYGDPNYPLRGEFSEDQTVVRYWTGYSSGADSLRTLTGIHFTRDSWKLVNSFSKPVWIYSDYFPGYITGYSPVEAAYVRCVKE
jgi:uncharacterized protein (TIGR02145 family)